VPESVSSRADEAVELARSAGLMLDPWQEDVLRASLGVDAEGRWAASEVGVIIPRQNGKGSVLEARELAGLFLFEEEYIVHSAHQVDTALEHFRRLLGLIEDCPDLDTQVSKVKNANGKEAIELKNGCRIRFRSRSRGGGKGHTGDLLVLDEAMFLPEFALTALLPSLSTKTMRQTWYTGSAVDQEVHENGVVFARVRERGISGESKRLAFFEWSPDTDETPGELSEDQLDDREWWAAANPQLGHRIPAEAVEDEREAMDVRGFAVDRLGIGDWPRTDGQEQTVINVRDWVALTDAQSAAEDPVCLAFDVSPDRRASIAVAGRREDGLFHVEVIENARGTGWIAERLAALVERHEVAVVICDGFGPAASMIPACKDADVAVETTTAGEMAQACGRLADAVDEKLIRHRGTDDLLNALRGAKSRPLGDKWAFARRSSSTDISSLVAVTLALSAAMDQPLGGDVVIY
jgi:hypothetical protein